MLIGSSCFSIFCGTWKASCEQKRFPKRDGQILYFYRMVLVTGGTGLVGSYLLMHLLEKEEKVRAIFRKQNKLENTRRTFEAFGKISHFEKINWVKADVLNIHALEHAFENIEHVYHCAAIVSFDPADEKRMMEVNIEGTANVVNVSLEKKIKKLCYVSSVAAIGEESKHKCSDEESEWVKIKHTSNYSISKHYAENEVWRASEEGLAVVIVNPCLILGYGNWNSGSLSIIKRVNEGLSFYPPGANSFVGVQDVAKIMVKLMESGIAGERFILSSENLSYKELLDKIATAFGKKKANKKAALGIGKILVFLDYCRNLIFGKKPLLTRESLNSSFSCKCYSNKKVVEETGFQFSSMEKVLKESAEKFQRFPY